MSVTLFPEEKHELIARINTLIAVPKCFPFLQFLIFDYNNNNNNNNNNRPIGLSPVGAGCGYY